MHPTPRLLRTGLPLLGLLLGLGPAAAQTPAGPLPTALDPCESVLALADERYLEGDYEAVELLVSDCVYRPSAAVEQVQRGYRLLALGFLRQDQLVEAQLAVVKLLGADFGYEPDPALDPPAYVALVGSVKDQLRVEPRPAGAVAPVEPRPLAEPPGLPPGVVSVNTGTAEDLQAVPGIGPVLASRIVAYREANGPFRRVGDLIVVRGVGPTTLERLAPHLTVDPGPLRVSAGGGVPAEGSGALPAPAGGLINLNTASAEELDALHGIGPALAARIVAYRATNGPFRRVEDVVAVRGIGPKTLEGFRARVTVE